MADRVDELLQILDIPHTRSALVNDTCDIVPLICTELFANAELLANNGKEVNEFFNLLPDICPVKELLVTLLLQMDTFKDDAVYFGLMSPIGKCIRKLQSKQYLSLNNALDTMLAHMKTVILPEEPNECTEFLQLDCSEAAIRMVALIAALLDFVSSFAQDRCPHSSIKMLDCADFDKQVASITRCLLVILGDGLCGLNVRIIMRCADNKSVACKSQQRICAKRCVQLLQDSHPDIVNMMSGAHELNVQLESRQSIMKHAGGEANPDDYETEELINDGMVSKDGLSVLAYLVFGERIVANCVPSVYQHRYLFEFNLGHVVQLLQMNRSAAVMKGVILCTSLLEHVDVGSLESCFFELRDMNKLIRAIVHTMISSRVKEVCQSAIKLLSILMKAFDDSGRYHLLEFLLSGINNENIHGHAIMMLKDEINERLGMIDSSQLNANGTVLSFLSRLHSAIFRVPSDGFRSKLLTEDQGRIMAALNLVRYLLIRDNAGQTGIWNVIGDINSKFLQPLRDGVKLARGDLHVKLLSLKDNIKQEGECRPSLQLNDKNVSNLTVDQEKDMINVGLINLDMVDSVLSRVEEIMHQHFVVT